VPWKDTTGTGRAGSQSATEVAPATGAAAARRSAMSQARTDVIIAPFDSPVTNTRAVSTHHVPSSWSSTSPMNRTSSEPGAACHIGTIPAPWGVTVAKPFSSPNDPSRECTAWTSAPSV